MFPEDIPEERVIEITNAARLEAIAEQEGARYGPELLKSTAGMWRRRMRSDPHYRSYGTLKFLLRHARSIFETQPTVAREITAVVIEFVDSAGGAPSQVSAISLRGLAHKEHANACEKAGDLREALSAAERAVQIYGTAPALGFEQTRAKLVAAKVLSEMGEVQKALDLSRECAGIFLDFGDLTFRNMARMIEANVLFLLKRFHEALAMYTDIMAQAELEGDDVTVARCLQKPLRYRRWVGCRSSLPAMR